MSIIKIKRGQSANVSSLTLEPGELAVTLDTKELYVGDENNKPAKIGESGRFATSAEIQAIFTGDVDIDNADFVVTYQLEGTSSVTKGLKVGAGSTAKVVLRDFIVGLNDLVTPFSISVQSRNPILTTLVGIFNNLTYLKKIDLTGLNTKSVTSIAGLFVNDSTLEEVIMNDMDFSSLSSLSRTFVDLPKLAKVEFTSNITPLIKLTDNMFDTCNAMIELKLELPNMPLLDSCVDTIRDCNGLINLDLSKFDISKARFLTRFVIFVDSLQSITLPIDFANATILDSLVRNAKSLTSIDFTGRTNNKFTSCEWMFMGDSSLTELDLTTLDFSNVKAMRNMFQNCTSLQRVLVNESWNNIPASVDKSTIFSGALCKEVTIVETEQTKTVSEGGEE